MTFGSISAVERSFRGPGGRKIGGSLEHTAPLAPGSSGGPLLDADGRLLGLNTNRLGEGFYLALPADAALRARVEALGRGESVARPRLGIAVAPARVSRRLRQSVGLPERDGVLVRGVEDDSPAARAGIRDGDLIVEIAGQAVTEADQLQEILASSPMPFEIKVVRGTDERTVSVGGEAERSGRGVAGQMVAEPEAIGAAAVNADADDDAAARRLLARGQHGRRAAHPVGCEPSGPVERRLGRWSRIGGRLHAGRVSS